MKKLILTFSLVLISIVCFGQSVNIGAFQQRNGSRPTIAVYVQGSVDDALKNRVASEATTSIASKDIFYTVERTSQFIDIIEKEIGHQLSGSVADEQIVKLGRELGAQYVCVVDVDATPTNVLKGSDELYCNVFCSFKILNVETKMVITSGSASRAQVAGAKEWKGIVMEAVNNMFNGWYYSEIRNRLKILGPFFNISELGELKIPQGYRCATQSEVRMILEYQFSQNMSTITPVAVEIHKMPLGERKWNVTFQYFLEDHSPKEIRFYPSSCWTRIKYQYKLNNNGKVTKDSAIDSYHCQRIYVYIVPL